MKIIEIPADERLRNKRKAALTRRRKAIGYGAFAVAILAVLCLVGALVCLVLTEAGERPDEVKTLLYILAGSFAGGAVLLGLLAFAFSKRSGAVYSAELDYRERCDGENSFFVGDGTLATFEENHLRLHAENGGQEQIFVPYSEMRFFSVCTRRAPREKGEWSVVMEIPVKYLSKDGEKDGEKPALVQADAKERLYRVLEENGLALVGERESAGSGKKFTPLQKYTFPDRAGRKRVLMQLILGAVCIGAGFGVAFFARTPGIILAVFGATLLGRAVWAYAAKKSVLSVYEEGMYWKEERRADSVFLKWEEITRISAEEKKGLSLLKVECAYGAYRFLSKEGVPEYIKEKHPEKCSEEK